MNKQRSMRSDDSSNDDVPRRVDKIYHSRAKDLYEIEAKQNNRYRPSSPIKKTKNAHKTVPLKDVKKGRLSFPEEYHDHDKQFTDKQKVKKSVINFGKFSAINPYNNFNKSTDRKK